VGQCNRVALAGGGEGEGGSRAEAEAADEDLHSLFSDLVDRDADCSAVDNQHRSALHLACRQGDLAVCASLLRAGVPLDLQCSEGVTPLCLAASVQSAAPGACSSHELCGLLIAKGSYPRIRDQQGRQALHYAAGNTLSHTHTLTHTLTVRRRPV
jgi:ankyrin repeat protein